jgi:hypothetical protein
LSFFDDDEVDEPEQDPRAASRSRRAPGRGGSRPPGGPPRRPPGSHNQEVQTRRLIAVVVVVVLVVAAALLIHSCDVSQTNDSLKTYAGNVDRYVNASDLNGQNVFKDLKSGDATSNLATLQSELFSAAHAASTQLTQAEDLNTPGAMSGAQQSFVEVMKLRYQGIDQIASHIQGAMNSATAVDDVNEITGGASLLYAADVLYKASVGTAIAAALNAAGLPIGGTTGASINPGQVVADLGWLNPATVALWLGATVPSSEVNSDQPGLHGHILNSVSVGGTALTTASVNPISDKSAPTFTLNLTNGGHFNENEVVCEISIKGVPKESAQSKIPQTTPGETTDCSVTLPAKPTAGLYTVTAGIEPVPGEVNTKDNYMTFNVNFGSSGAG